MDRCHLMGPFWRLRAAVFPARDPPISAVFPLLCSLREVAGGGEEWRLPAELVIGEEDGGPRAGGGQVG